MHGRRLVVSSIDRCLQGLERPPRSFAYLGNSMPVRDKENFLVFDVISAVRWILQRHRAPASALPC
jgi:hypothetical protein